MLLQRSKKTFLQVIAAKNEITGKLRCAMFPLTFQPSNSLLELRHNLHSQSLYFLHAILKEGKFKSADITISHEPSSCRIYGEKAEIKRFWDILRNICSQKFGEEVQSEFYDYFFDIKSKHTHFTPF